MTKICACGAKQEKQERKSEEKEEGAGEKWSEGRNEGESACQQCSKIHIQDMTQNLKKLFTKLYER